MIEDHKSLELAGIARNITKSLEELVSKIQLKSNIYLDEIKNLKYEQIKAKEAHQELFEKLEQLESNFKDHLDTNKLLPRFKEEILKCLDDEEFRIKVQMILGLPAKQTEHYKLKNPLKEKIFVAVEKGLQKYAQEVDIPSNSLAFNELWGCRQYIVDAITGEE